MTLKKRILHVFFLATGLLAPTAAATTVPPLPATFMTSIQDVQNMLLQVGGALGILMIAFESIKWITAEGPAERESAKKGVIYILIGLLLLKSAERIIYFLLLTI